LEEEKVSWEALSYPPHQFTLRKRNQRAREGRGKIKKRVKKTEDDSRGGTKMTAINSCPRAGTSRSRRP